jgi:FtsZ-binding cell division protein ZapB
MDNKAKRDSTNDYTYPDYMEEEEVKYQFIKELKEKEKDYGNAITNLNSLQSELDSLNKKIVDAKSSQTRDTLELNRNVVREKIMEKQKRLNDILGQMSNITQGGEFKGTYNSFLDSSKRTVDQIFKKSDELQSNIDSFNTEASDYQKHIGDFTDVKLRLQSSNLFYQTWIFLAIISIVVIVMNKRAPTRIILLLLVVYVLYVLYNFYYVIVTWLRNLF